MDRPCNAAAGNPTEGNLSDEYGESLAAGYSEDGYRFRSIPSRETIELSFQNGDECGSLFEFDAGNHEFGLEWNHDVADHDEADRDVSGLNVADVADHDVADHDVAGHHDTGHDVAHPKEPSCDAKDHTAIDQGVGTSVEDRGKMLHEMSLKGDMNCAGRRDSGQEKKEEEKRDEGERELAEELMGELMGQGDETLVDVGRCVAVSLCASIRGMEMGAEGNGTTASHDGMVGGRGMGADDAADMHGKGMHGMGAGAVVPLSDIHGMVMGGQGMGAGDDAMLTQNGMDGISACVIAPGRSWSFGNSEWMGGGGLEVGGSGGLEVGGSGGLEVGGSGGLEVGGSGGLEVGGSGGEMDADGRGTSASNKFGDLEWMGGSGPAVGGSSGRHGMDVLLIEKPVPPHQQQQQQQHNPQCLQQQQQQQQQQQHHHLLQQQQEKQLQQLQQRHYHQLLSLPRLPLPAPYAPFRPLLHSAGQIMQQQYLQQQRQQQLHPQQQQEEEKEAEEKVEEEEVKQTQERVSLLSLSPALTTLCSRVSKQEAFVVQAGGERGGRVGVHGRE
ncbi:unnamed protein product [Closterium sp. NIES-64]|nr:unnamed protein product [Closterium sp. NIES-64]